MADTKAERGSFSSDMGVLLESGEGADVVLVVGDSQLPAHSNILTARSPVFTAMLRNDMWESSSRRIEITDVQEAVVRQVLSFMYSDEAPLLGSMAAELLMAADKYDLPLLKQRCEQQLARDLSVENAADTAGLAELHRCPELRKATLEFIGRQPEVLATAGWERLMRENVEAAVEISKQVAAAELRPRSRSLTMEQKQVLSERLGAAASKGEIGEVRALLVLAAPLDVKDIGGNYALFNAANNGHADIVRCLIDAGADVNARSVWNKRSPLHSAASNGCQHIVWMLVAASAQVDVQDNGGETPLHVAARCRHQCATRALLLAGARRDIEDNKGYKPAV